MFPKLSEVVTAIKNNKKIDEGGFKSCYEFDDDFVILTPFFDYESMDGFLWLDFIIKSGLVVGKRYDIKEDECHSFAYVVEKVSVADSEKFSQHVLVRSTSRDIIIEKMYPAWHIAIEQFKRLHQNKDIYEDFTERNFGFRSNGEPVLFDVLYAYD